MASSGRTSSRSRSSSSSSSSSSCDYNCLSCFHGFSCRNLRSCVPWNLAVIEGGIESYRNFIIFSLFQEVWTLISYGCHPMICGSHVHEEQILRGTAI